MTDGFMGGGGPRMSIPQSHLARTVRQVHDPVQLGNRGTAGTVTTERQVAVRRTGELCEINGVRRQRQGKGLRYS